VLQAGVGVCRTDAFIAFPLATFHVSSPSREAKVTRGHLLSTAKSPVALWFIPATNLCPSLRNPNMGYLCGSPRDGLVTLPSDYVRLRFSADRNAAKNRLLVHQQKCKSCLRNRKPGTHYSGRFSVALFVLKLPDHRKRGSDNQPQRQITRNGPRRRFESVPEECSKQGRRPDHNAKGLASDFVNTPYQCAAGCL
jgi:hypothetical protein